MPENWGRPSPEKEWKQAAIAEEQQFNASMARAGLVVFVISIFLYALAIWSLSIILRNSSLIEESISWQNAYMAAGIIQVLRIIDRTLWVPRR